MFIPKEEVQSVKKRRKQMNETAMMAMIIVSTAFAGLTGVVIGQIVVSGKKSKRTLAIKVLAASCGLGVLVAAFSILGLLLSWGNNPCNFCWWLYGGVIFQLLLFWAAAAAFWI